MTAAAAVLFDTVPGLRTGLGNIVWFFGWMVAAVAGGGAPLGGLGPVRASMRETVAAAHSTPAREWSLGFTQVDRPLAVFEWGGWDVTGAFALGRLLLVVVAAGLAAAPAIWFGRFDPARVSAGGASVAVTMNSGRAQDTVEDERSSWSRLLSRPLSPVPRSLRPVSGRMVLGELRILVSGVSGWWWSVVLAVNVAGLVAPTPAVPLAAAWIWPILTWSRLGTHHREHGLEPLLESYPSGTRRWVAQWLAGVVFTAVTGCGPLLRMTIVGDGPAVAQWLTGAVFIPSLALVLGTISRTHRTFQVVYVIVWYAAVNQVAALDVLGVVVVDGRPAGPAPDVVGGAALAMLAATLTVRAVRHALR